MKNWGRLFLLAVLFFAGCSRRDWVKPADIETRAFTYFLFLKIGDQNFNCSGDAVIGEGWFFRARLYDNVLGQKIGELEFQKDGSTWVAIESERMVYYQKESGLPALFCDILPAWLSGRALPKQSAEWKINPQGLENNLFDSIIMESGGRTIRARIVAKTDEGLPRRFRIELREVEVTMDITRESELSYVPDTNGYQTRFLPEGGDLFSLIGDRYAR